MMTRSRFLGLAAAAALTTGLAQAQTGKVYELRTYTANPGKLGELVRFFQEASDPAFLRHNMRSIGYWIPTDQPEHSNTLVYILEHPSREEATKNWAAFRTDEAWLKARAAFEANGPLQNNITAVFMEQLNIPGGARQRMTPGAFELRTYTAHPGRLNDVIARFRDHTNSIFNRLDMKSVAYWRPLDAPLHDNTLIYIIEHDSKAAGVTSWDKFRNDPEWVKARTASEANGPIVEKAVGVYMEPVSFSALK